MSRDALKTLFHPFASATVAAPGEGERILFLGAEAGFCAAARVQGEPDCSAGFSPSLSPVAGKPHRGDA